jgi:hypothetical protein
VIGLRVRLLLFDVLHVADEVRAPSTTVVSHASFFFFFFLFSCLSFRFSPLFVGGPLG